MMVRLTAITFVKGGNKGAEGNVSFWYKWDGDGTTGQSAP